MKLYIAESVSADFTSLSMTKQDLDKARGHLPVLKAAYSKVVGKARVKVKDTMDALMDKIRQMVQYSERLHAKLKAVHDKITKAKSGDLIPLKRQYNSLYETYYGKPYYKV